MTDEQQWQEKYLQFQMLQQQIEKITEHVELLNQQNAELDISKSAVSKIGETPTDNDILSPVANGIFIKAKLTDNQKLIVNVGSNTTVEKTVAEVVGLLGEQQKEMSKKLLEAEGVLQDLQSQAMKIYEEVKSVQ